MSIKHFLQGSWLYFDGWLKVCLYPARRSKSSSLGIQGDSMIFFFFFSLFFNCWEVGQSGVRTQSGCSTWGISALLGPGLAREEAAAGGEMSELARSHGTWPMGQKLWVSWKIWGRLFGSESSRGCVVKQHPVQVWWLWSCRRGDSHLSSRPQHP